MRAAKRVALAGISSAFSTIFLIMSVYVPFVDMSCLVLASIAVLLPLSKNQYGGAILCYISTSLLGFLTTGNIFKVLPYIIFFGLHPIILCLTKKIPSRWLGLLLRLVFANLAILIAWKFLGAVVAIMDYEFPYWLLAVGGSFVFVLYDGLMDRIRYILGYYIDKFMNKGKGT